MINAKLMLSCYYLEEALLLKLANTDIATREKRKIEETLEFINELIKIELIVNPYEGEEDENNQNLIDFS